MNKLNERLTLIANISVVLGIIFLAVELQQNTQAVQAQTRDSISEKQMDYTLQISGNRDLADVYQRGNNVGLEGLEQPEQTMYRLTVAAIFREFENSFYQYERGLFTEEEFLARTQFWRDRMRTRGYRSYWDALRQTFAPSFRAEIDRIVAEVGG